MIETTIGNTCWKELANAIVIQAVVDYRKLRRKQRSGVVLKPEEQSDYEKIRRFFCGEWFVMNAATGERTAASAAEGIHCGT